MNEINRVGLFGEVGEGFAPKKQRITHDRPRPFVTLDLAVALPLGNWLFI